MITKFKLFENNKWPYSGIFDEKYLFRFLDNGLISLRDYLDKGGDPNYKNGSMNLAYFLIVQLNRGKKISNDNENGLTILGKNGISKNDFFYFLSFNPDLNVEYTNRADKNVIEKGSSDLFDYVDEDLKQEIIEKFPDLWRNYLKNKAAKKFKI